MATLPLLLLHQHQKLQQMFILLTLFICLCHGSVHQYKLSGFEAWDNGYTFFGGSEGMFGNSNATSISFDVSFRRTVEAAARHDTMESRTGLIEAVLFSLEDREYIGMPNSTGGEKILCCSPEIAAQVHCRVGEVILKNRKDGWPRSIKASFQGTSLVQTMTLDVKITETGLYTLYFVYCEPQLKDLHIKGTTVWKNPSGFLPGRMAPLLKFYGTLSLAYLLLGFVWFVQYARYWKDILQLQNCISVVIFLGHAEMALWYFDFANFNATGRRPVGITVWAVTVGAMKKTLSRLLVLIVSMGFGVVKPTLGGITGKVLLAGATYFVAAEALDLAENVQQVDDFSKRERILLVLPVAAVDAFFILWIFSALSKTLEGLQAKKQMAKLELYKRFTNSLALAVIASILWIGYEFYLKSTDSYNLHWQTAWTVPGFWILLSFVMLCVICYLWKPSKNSTRYAYSEEIDGSFDAEEGVQLTSSVPSGPHADSSGSKDAAKSAEDSAATDVFSIGEEDKRD